MHRTEALETQRSLARDRVLEPSAHADALGEKILTRDQLLESSAYANVFGEHLVYKTQSCVT